MPDFPNDQLEYTDPVTGLTWQKVNGRWQPLSGLTELATTVTGLALTSDTFAGRIGLLEQRTEGPPDEPEPTLDPDAPQTLTAVAGINVVDLALGRSVHVVATAGAFTLQLSNVPSGRVEVLLTVNVTNDGDVPSVAGASDVNTAPATWDEGVTYVMRLTRPPFLDVWLTEYLWSATTPDPTPDVTPPTLSAHWSAEPDLSSPVVLEADTLPPGEVAVFFTASDPSVVESVRIFANHVGALPDAGSEGDSHVRDATTSPFTLLGESGGLAIMWDTTVDPTGNNRVGYDPNGETSFSIEARLIDGEVVVETFTFNTGNTPIGDDPTITHTQTGLANAATGWTVTVPDGVDRLVVVQAHYNVSGSQVMNGLTLNGVQGTLIAGATKDAVLNEGRGVRTVYFPEAQLTTGVHALTPSFTASPGSFSGVHYHVWVLTNVDAPSFVGHFDYDNVGPTVGNTQTPTVTSPANAILLTSASHVGPDDATVSIGTPYDLVNTTSPTLESRSSDVADSGAAGSEVATWGVVGRAVSVLVAIGYTASSGGSGTTPIIPAVPVITSVVGGDQRITATWGAATDAVSYELRYGAVVNPNVPSGVPITATSPRVVSGLAASTSYGVQVRSVSSTNDRSAWSAVSYATTTAATTPPVFSDKFLVSFDHRDVAMGEGYGTPHFSDLWMQKGFHRINVASTEYALGDAANNTLLDKAIGNWEGRGSQARAFRTACGPRLIVTSKLAIVGSRQNSTASAANKAAAIADMGKSGSKGSINRNEAWVRLGNQLNRQYRGHNVYDIVFLSISHENNGAWAYSYSGRNTQLIGQPALTGATNAQYGSEMGAALRYAGETGDCAIVHKLACENVIDIIQGICGGKAIIGMTPSDGESSDITGTEANSLGSTWVRSSFPDRDLDFLCPTMYFRGQNNVVYDGSGSVDDWTNYDRTKGWLEYTHEYVNDIYGCAFGLLEFGGDFALPGSLTVGAGDSQTDEEMKAGFVRVLEHILTDEVFPNGLAFINWWWFLNWVGSQKDPGCSYNLFEGMWGQFPANVVPTGTGKPSWSTVTSNNRYPKTLAYLQSQYAVGV